MLRILQVCSASQAVYGAAKSLTTLSKALRQSGHEVSFCTFKGRDLGREVEKMGFRALELRFRTKIDFFAIARLARTIRRERIDLVHTHLSTSSVNGTLAARLAGVPSIATVHGLSGKLSFTFAHHLIAVSGEVRDHMVAQGIPPSKISVVYNGLDFGDDAPARQDPSVEDLNLRGWFPVLGTTARVTPLKGINYALEAVALLKRDYPRIKYVVLGSGDALEPCREQAKALGLGENVAFCGYVQNVRPYLEAMDVFVFPSLKEAMGIALVEAMAAGLPVVATNVGGIPEVVTPTTGLLVPPERPVRIAEEVAKLAGDESLRAAMGRAGAERVRKYFTAQAMAANTEKVYQALLQESLAGQTADATADS
jgi:glycosyltransferase involved in cell wall biosynthesis